MALVLNVGGVAVLYVTQMLLARWMGGAEAYGAYSYAFTWSQMVAFIAGLGIPVAAVRFIPQYIEHADHQRLHGFLRSGWLLCLIGGILLAAIGTLLTLVLAPDDLRQVMLIGLWLSPLLAVVNFQKEAARGARHMALSLAPTQVLHPALLIVAAFVLYRLNGALLPTDALILLGVSGAVVLLVQWRGLNRILPHDGTIRRMYEVRGWLAVALPLFLVQESLVVLRQTDVVMIQYFLEDTAEVGRYNAAVRTAMLARFALLALNAIAAPLVASLHARGDHAALQRMVRTATRWMFWPSLVLTLAACLLAEPVLGLFGHEFRAAAAALWILAIGQLIGASFGPVGHLLNMTGHHNKSMRVFGVTAGINLAMNATLIPLWGIEGAAFATSLSLLIRNTWAYTLVRKHLNIHSFAFFGSKNA